ncbi:MAG TPA: sugar phosphate isomerase/epimerase family protein [Bryobacteraceae bacterium]
MKISLGSWAFSFGPYAGNPVPLDRIVERVAQAGYDGIELSGFPPHVALDDYLTQSSRQELVNFISGHGLGISGYSADFSWVNPTVEGQQQKYLDLFRRYIDLCVDLASPLIRVDSISAPGSLSDSEYRQAFGRLADTWREAAEFAATAGVRVAWEFEPGFIFNKPSEVVAMHKQVNHPNFRVMFDTCHAYMCGVIGARQHGPREVLAGGVKEFLEKLSGRIGAIHLIDSDGSLHGDETSTHRPFGEGRIDFEGLTPRLLEVPDIHWWTIDMCFWAGSWDLIPSSRRYLNQLLQYHEAFR